MNQPDPTPITVTDFGEYIRHQSCDRRFFLTVHYDREVRDQLPFFDRLLNTLEPVVAEVGTSRENQWEKELADNGFLNLAVGLPKDKRDDVAWADFAAELATLPSGSPAYARQVRVQADVGRAPSRA